MHLTNKLSNPLGTRYSKKKLHPYTVINISSCAHTATVMKNINIQPEQQHKQHRNSTHAYEDEHACVRVCLSACLCPRLCVLCVSVWVWVQTAVALVIHPGSQGSQLLLPDAWEAAGVEWQQQLLSPIWLLIRELSPLSDTRHSPLSKQWFRLVKH